jgi:glutamate synthase (NADPH/NADH) small chain
LHTLQDAGGTTTAVARTLVPGNRPKSGTGPAVVVAGAGPVGLALAVRFAALGHAVTLVERDEKAGGSLLDLTEEQLPRAAGEADVAAIAAFGVVLRTGVTVTVDDVAGWLGEGRAVAVATGKDSSLARIIHETSSRKLGFRSESRTRPEQRSETH